MGDYERSTTIDIAVDDLFQYLSEVDHLPEYMERMTEAHSVGGDEVSVEARLDDEDEGTIRRVRGEAWFRVDADHRRLAWGSEGPNDYHGELEVSAGADGASTVSVVTLRLHTEHEAPDAIEQGIDETLENIRRIAATRVQPGSGAV